jgi:hypothetical protein
MSQNLQNIQNPYRVGMRPTSLLSIGKLITIVAAIFLTSCEKEIEFKGEQSDPRLVINSLVQPNEPVKANIGKSYFFLDTPNTTPPADLVASLYVNDNLVGEMTPSLDTVWDQNLIEFDDEGHPHVSYRLVTVYKNDYCPLEGDIVKITATANGFDEVEGLTSPLPKLIDFQCNTEILDWSSYYYHPYFDGDVYEEDSLLRITGNLELTINITDPNPGQTDYFRLRLVGDYGTYDEENMRYVSFDYDDPVFGATLSENELIDVSELDTRPEGVFTDALFDGKTYPLKMKIFFEMDVAEEFDPAFFRAPFGLQHLSKEYYNYLNTRDQGELALQLWAEPVQVYSNVTNGYGIVAGRTLETIWVDLPLER